MTDEDVSLDEQPKVETDEPEDEAAEPQAELSEEEAEQAKLKEAIGVQAEDAGTLRKKLTVTVPRELIDERLHEQFAELRREAQVAGFRRGRAPLRLIEKRFGRDVGDQMTPPLVGNAFLAALEKEGLKERTIGEPRVWVKVPEQRTSESGRRETVVTDKLLELDKAVEHLDLPGEGPLSFSCEVELRPEFELPDLKGIRVERPTLEITDRLIDSEIDRRRSLRGQYVPVESGSVEADDLVVADVKVTVGNQVLLEEANQLLSARDQRVANIPIEGLGAALTGKTVDAKVEVQATVPDDHENADLRGKTARMELTVRDIKRLQLPELDEMLLADLGADSVADLREQVRQDLEQQRSELLRGKMRNDVRQYLLKNTALEIPAGLSQRQTDRAVTRRMMELYRLGFPQQEIEKRIDRLRAAAAEEAVEDLKMFFIMEQVATQLEVTVAEEELNAAIASIARRRGRRFDRVRDELAQRGSLDALYVQLRDEKIIDRLITDAEIVETTGSEGNAGSEGPADAT